MDYWQKAFLCPLSLPSLVLGSLTLSALEFYDIFFEFSYTLKLPQGVNRQLFLPDGAKCKVTLSRWRKEPLQGDEGNR